MQDQGVIERAVESVLDDFGAGHGHVFNLGHGITPGVNPTTSG
ncbi:MAG: hypothetical protein Ct9H300mP14_07740 [Gammaproteobacteria bacterium]|nr:MAG: hypothetical protein Ct9H300mP14_07740 [Gammaproteobacteria bacterium]